MSLLSVLTRRTSLKQEISQSWEDRNTILNPDVNLFCWQRKSVASIKNYLERIIVRDLENIQVPVNLDNLQAQIHKAAEQWNDLKDDGKNFWEDVSHLTRDFLQFSDQHQATLHLKIVRDNGCTKFHTDGYALRLFTTYLGEGTQWLPEDAVNRTGLGKSNEMIVKNELQIRQMMPFEVGILKGELYNKSSSSRGIVHRSPPVGDTGGSRIILRIDI